MRRGRHSVEHERRCRGSCSDVGRAQHRNLYVIGNPNFSKAGSSSAFALIPPSTTTVAPNQKSLLMHTSVQKLAAAVQQGAR